MKCNFFSNFNYFYIYLILIVRITACNKNPETFQGKATRFRKFSLSRLSVSCNWRNKYRVVKFGILSTSDHQFCLAHEIQLGVMVFIALNMTSPDLSFVNLSLILELFKSHIKVIEMMSILHLHSLGQQYALKNHFEQIYR